jgi:hypothetical protein
MQAILSRFGAACGLLYVVLLFGFTSIGSDAKFVLIAELVGMLLFLPFLGYLYGVLRAAEGESGWLSATALGAGLVDLTIKLGSIAPSFAAQQPGLPTPLHDALHKMNSVAFIVTLLPIGVMLAAAAIVILKTRVLPLWLGLFAALTAPACWVNGMFLDAEFGPAFLLFLLWISLASIVLTLRAGRSHAGSTDHAPAKPTRDPGRESVGRPAV